MSRYFYNHCVTCEYLYEDCECIRYPEWVVIKNPTLHFCGEYKECNEIKRFVEKRKSEVSE